MKAKVCVYDLISRKNRFRSYEPLTLMKSESICWWDPSGFVATKPMPKTSMKQKPKFTGILLTFFTNHRKNKTIVRITPIKNKPQRIINIMWLHFCFSFSSSCWSCLNWKSLSSKVPGAVYSIYHKINQSDSDIDRHTHTLHYSAAKSSLIIAD